MAGAMTENLRALDAECAQKVMGWEHAVPEYGSEVSHCWYKDGQHVAHLDDWRPTTDIRHAWQLLERLVADGAYVELSAYDGLWWAKTDCAPNGTFDEFTEAAMPLAIVRMALAVKGGSNVHL